MRLVKNIPLNTNIIADLISDPEDLYLVWPDAKVPFDHEQWAEVLNPDKGNLPFLVYEGDQLIGHAALRTTGHKHTYAVSYLYILPGLRSKGIGRDMVLLLEQYARENLNAKKLCLRVRTYNPRAQNCYKNCGFEEESREGTLIRMYKMI